MPAARNDTDGDQSRLRRELVDDDTQGVGFLDLPDVDAEAVVDRIVDAFSQLHHDAVVTVYCDRVDAQMLSAGCRSHELEVVHSVPHDAGTTFVLKRSSASLDTQPGSR